MDTGFRRTYAHLWGRYRCSRRCVRLLHLGSKHPGRHSPTHLSSASLREPSGVPKNQLRPNLAGRAGSLNGCLGNGVLDPSRINRSAWSTCDGVICPVCGDSGAITGYRWMRAFTGSFLAKAINLSSSRSLRISTYSHGRNRVNMPVSNHFRDNAIHQCRCAAPCLVILPEKTVKKNRRLTRRRARFDAEQFGVVPAPKKGGVLSSMRHRCRSEHGLPRQ